VAISYTISRDVAQYSVVMSDIKPPRLAGGEAETLHALLQYQRDSLVRKGGRPG
jgi:hypothetical protein